MALSFTKATKKNSRLRLALVGPSGSGKTFTALRVGCRLGAKVAVIDSERGSASKYADRFQFDVLELEDFAPEQYVAAIHAAEAAGYDVVIIDSLSHAWDGKDGALEQVDKVAARSRSQNSFAAWREVTPRHNEMVDAILRCRAHVIATMRTKTEWVLEKDEKTGKQAPRKVGLQPVQRQGVEYEFDVVGDIDDAKLLITKTRCPDLHDKAILKPGEDFADTLKAWLTDGVDAPEPTREPRVEPPKFHPEAEVARLWKLAQERSVTAEAWKELTRKVLGVQKPYPLWTREDAEAVENALPSPSNGAGAHP